MASIISVLIKPGATQLTVMPLFATSFAIVLVNASRAPFEDT